MRRVELPSMHTNVEELCRLCAQRNKEVVPIFSRRGQDKELATKINSSLPILVTERDQLPLTVCLHCMLWLEMVHELWQRCREADVSLRRSLSNQLQLQQNNNAADLLTCNKEIDNWEADTATQVEFMEKDQILRNVSCLKLWCSECKEWLPDTDNFKAHELAQHGRVLAVCNECCVFFSSYSQLKVHQQALHNTADLEVAGSDSESCPSIPDQFNPDSDQDELESPFTSNQHNYLHINKPSAKISLAKLYSRPNPKPLKQTQAKKIRVKPNKLKCKTCNKIYPIAERPDYIKHKSEHRSEKRMVRNAEKLKTSTIQCDNCDLKFLTEISKVKHMIKKHEYKPFMCEQCGKRFQLKISLKNHITIHQNERPFCCEVCGKCFTAQAYLRCHSRSHIIDEVTCSVCSMKVRAYLVKRHMRNHYTERRFQCEECGESFFARDCLKQHMGSHSDTLYECEICGTCCSNDENLDTHRKNHFDCSKQRYICPIQSCNKTFPIRSGVIEHCKSHSNEDYKLLKKVMTDENSAFYCSYCKAIFRHLPMYLEHMGLHKKETGSKPNEKLVLTCNFCQESMSDDKILMKHLEKHPEALDFHCRHCKDTFLTSDQRKFHEETVHGGRAGCMECFKTYRDKQKLRVHKNRHTGNRPYECKVCDKKFYAKKHLSQHNKIHTGEKKFKCGICSKSFRFKPDMKKHMMAHNNLKASYKCRYCDFSSNRRKDVLNHEIYQHDHMSNAKDHAFTCVYVSV